MRIELCKGDTMTAKEYEKVLKDREKAWTNEEFKPHKLTEEEIEKRGTHLKMDDFRIIYKILRILQNSMDLEEFDRNSISAEALGQVEQDHDNVTGRRIHNWCRNLV